MAKQRYGINDGFRGTVGTVIGYEWNGRWCMRSRPRHVHNPRTVKQQQNRGLFAAASRLATAMGEALRMGMLSAARECHRTVYNHFLSVNTECFSLINGQLNVDYENLVVSEGGVAPVGFSHPALRAPLSEREDGYRHTSPPLREGWTPKADVVGYTITVPFEKNPLHLRSNNDDKVYLWAWCPERMEGVLSVPAYRRSKQVSIVLPSRWEGQEVHLYGFVEDYVGKASNSTYLGTLTTGQTEEILTVPHNKINYRALGNTSTNNKYHETDTNIGSYASACWCSLGSDSSARGEGDARGRESGGS